MHIRDFRSVMLSSIGLLLLAFISSVAALADGSSAAPPPQGPFGDEYVFEHSAHLTPAQRAEIEERLARNAAELRAAGKLGSPTESIVLLDWPLSAWNGLTDPGYHGISGFIDRDPVAPGSLEDYECGTRTYDTAAGYNHSGIDYFNWPFDWYKVDNDQVAAVAAAAGTIVGKDDGFPHFSCVNNSDPWNAVYVEHSDGSVAWYGHLKNGSLTTKTVGQTVVVGEFLGIVASSGNSSGPHLHLEIRDSSNNVVDPYTGACNPNPSWWNAQRPYYDSAINRIQTGKAAAVDPACPTIETLNADVNFNTGDPLYLTAFYRDQLSGQIGTYTIYRPDSSVFTTWTHSSGAAHYSASWWWWNYASFPGTQVGTWTFEVVFEGVTYQTTFTIGVPYCGDGIVDPGEDCDDAGESVACNSDCTLHMCGDGNLNITAGEECDDGNIIPGDGCSDLCQAEGCGDGSLDFGEECDDGNEISGDGCSDVCLDEFCGNGIVDITSTTKVSVVDPVALVVPDGGLGGQPGPVVSDTIDIVGSTPIADVNIDIGLTHSWISHVTFSVVSPGGTEIELWDQICGPDQYQDIVTEFDDEGTAQFCNDSGPTPDPNDGNGNVIPLGGVPLSVLDGTDGEGTWTLKIHDNEGLRKGTLDQWSVHIVPREACDDGNLIEGDGCDTDCSISACGNGIVSPSEECDDGNLIDDDGCDLNCTFTACGNGVVTAPEECDDGNLAPGDGCDDFCFCEAVDSDLDGVLDCVDACPGEDDSLLGTPCGSTDVGACEFGALECSTGTLLCGGEIIAEPEICDGLDNDCDGALPAGEGDTDGDLLPDCFDPCLIDPLNDIDDDGVCADSDPCPFDPDDDSDGDGLCADVDPCPNDPDNDIDGDGICGDVDICPNDPDDDIDQDNLCGDVDNCPSIPNNGAGSDDYQGGISYSLGAAVDFCTDPAWSACVDGSAVGWPAGTYCVDPGITEMDPAGTPCTMNGSLPPIGGVFEHNHPDCAGTASSCAAPYVWHNQPNSEQSTSPLTSASPGGGNPLTRPCTVDADCNDVQRDSDGDGVGDACDTCIGDDALIGTPCSSNIGECVAGTYDCSSGTLVCTGIEPTAEVCDGLDNDCDGAVDNGDPGGGASCGTGLPGVCAAGTTVCTGGAIVCNQDIAPSAEVCDGLDNDCDGVDDDGDPGGGASCSTGLLGVCDAGTTFCSGGGLVCNQDTTPSAEVCDGLDNDCDGANDDGDPGGGASCSTGLLGVCDPGTTVCSGGGLVCNQDTAPSAEVCDGLDNDCDGVDDDGDPGGGASCSTGLLGVCDPGTTVCSGGGLVCSQDTAPSAEVCDGLDNDCDGVDDDGDPGGGASCSTGLLGVCDAGTTFCSGGGLVCNQDTAPSAEVCDGLDNDCDGVDDDGDPGGGASCSTGLLGVCDPGTTVCTGGGLVCSQDNAPSAEVCDGLDNDCDGVDDNGDPVGGASCSTGLPGVCDPGTTQCSGGGLVCNQDTAPGAEVCDGLDNDCDGAVDDGDPGGGVSCSSGLPGVCDAGTTVCSAGGLVCDHVLPSAEICDGLDNDCDGFLPGNELDTDGDGAISCADNCPLTPNPGQGTATFDGLIEADNLFDYVWLTPQDVMWVRGELSGVSTYSTVAVGTLSAATSLHATQIPMNPGEGYYWLFKPDCVDATWSSGGSGECLAPGGCPPGERDGSLP